MVRYRTYSLTNIAGLAIGIACCLFILLYIHDELSYDRYHVNSGLIYRVGQEGVLGGIRFKGATTPGPVSKTLQKEFGNYLTSTRLYKGINTVITYEGQSYFESRYLYADSNFFKVFSFPMVRGNPETALNRPHSMVITESIARKYFGSDDPIGKILHEADGNDFVITGVTHDVPENSHFHYDFLASSNTVEFDLYDRWLSTNYFYTYILVDNDVLPQKLFGRINKVLDGYITPQLAENMGIKIDKLQASGNEITFYFEPLKKIYLYSDATEQIEPVGDIRYVYFFSFLALFIMVLAFINFTSLTTAKSTTRAREVGMRKVLGSYRGELIRQMLTESVAITFIAFLLAMTLVEMLLPGFNDLTGKSLNLKIFGTWYFIPLLFILVVIIGILAGSYSSVSLSSMKILNVLRGNLMTSNRTKWYRSSLVVFQFIIAVVIIISTLIIHSQMIFINRQKLGFNEEHVVVVDRAYGLEGKVSVFKEKLTKLAGVQNASVMLNIPGKEGWFSSIVYPENKESGNLLQTKILAGDFDMMETMGFEMVAGRFFSKEDLADTLNFVINETTARSLGFSDPVGRYLYTYSWDRKVAHQIIGVVKDFHFRPLSEKIDNVVIPYPGKFFMRYVAVRLQPETTQATLKEIEKLWSKLSVNQPFSYFFLDQTFDDLYKSEVRTVRIFSVFAILAFIIASMGLVGLASFISELRIREIGIRKVMGAGRMNIVGIFAKEFVRWVLLANVLSWPLAYYFMNNWLHQFVYRISFPWWIMLITLLLTMFFALVTVSYQTVMAVLKKPSESIRYE